MKLKGIILILFLTLIVKTNHVKAQELWQLQPWAPDSTYVIGAYASGEPRWLPFGDIITAGDSLYINGTGDTIFLRDGEGWVPYLVYSVIPSDKTLSFSNNQGLLTLYHNKLIPDDIPATTKYVLHTDGAGSYQFDTVRWYRIGDTKFIRMAIGSEIIGNIDFAPIVQDSIYNVGDTIRLRDGLGEVVITGGGPDSTIVADGYGINVTEYPANTWTVSADTAQLATQSDISAFPDGSGETNKVAYWSDANTLTRDTALHWNPTSKILGVGTTSPVGLGSTVHVHGTTFSTLNLTNSTTGQAGTDGSRIYTVGDSLYISNTENGRIDIGTNNANRMTITGAGRVGINNTNPSTTLAVGGEVTISSLDSDGSAPTTSGTLVKVVSDGNGKLSFQTNNTGTVTSVGLTTGTSGTDVSVSGSPVTGSGTITLNIPTASASNRGALSSTDWTTFNNKPGGSGAATRVAFWSGSNTLSSNSNLYWDNTNSRLGIGTTSPGGLLGLYSSGAAQTLEFNRTGGWHQSDITNYYDSFTNKGLRLGGNASYGQTTMPNVLTINNYNNNSGGRVGIETDDPQTRLHITVPSAVNSEDGIRLDHSSSFYSLMQTNSEGDLVFRTTTGHMSIGPVASSLNALNPSAALHLLGTAAIGQNSLIKLEKPGYTDPISFTASYVDFENSGLLLLDSDFSFLTFNTFRNRVGVGLGAAVPTRLMDINGEVRIRDLVTTNPTFILGADNDGVTSRVTLGTGLSFTGTTLNAATGDSDWGVIGSVMCNWGATGTFGSGLDVGIGTCSPSRDLDVNGTTRLRGAIYDSGNSAGTSGQVLTSQGSGAWTWTTPASIVTNQVGGIYLTGTINDFSFDGTYRIVDWNYLSASTVANGGVTASTGTGEVTVAESGTYEISYSATIVGPSGHKFTTEFLVYNNGSSMGRRSAARSMSDTNSASNTYHTNISNSFVTTLTAGDDISLYYARTAGTVNTLDIYGCNLTVKRLY